MRVANEGHGDGRWRCRLVEIEPHSVLIVDAYLALVGAFEFFVFQAFPVPKCEFGFCVFDHQQLVPARFNNRDWQPEPVSLGCSYEREAGISELDLHSLI